MKTNKTTATAALLGVSMALFTPMAFAQGNSESAPGQLKKLPIMPVGWIDAYPTIVQTGTHPQVRWGINLPASSNEVVNVSQGTITMTEQSCIECRMIGNGVTAYFADGTTQPVAAEALISLNGSSFQRVFFGNNGAVNPNTIVWQASDVRKNQTIRFAGRYQSNNVWGPLYSAGSANVRLLIDGQLPPTSQPLHNSPMLQDFMKPYLDSTGRVNIGPMDFLVMMELTHAENQTSNAGYDLQDLVMLCTLKPKGKTNNGHGNNIDGIDSSNPGNAPFMYLDSDPNFDDEGSGGGAAPSHNN